MTRAAVEITLTDVERSELARLTRGQNRKLGDCDTMTDPANYAAALI